MAEGLPEEANGIGNSRINDRDGNMLIAVNSSHVHFPGGPFPAKIWMPTNQIRVVSARELVHTYPANKVRVQLRHLGVYIKRELSSLPSHSG